ncbi:MAG: hypothetical protein PHY54_00070 [Methylococcales bacterium]|nr:hypothetical protein [Methylococcales bacterium]
MVISDVMAYIAGTEIMAIVDEREACIHGIIAGIKTALEKPANLLAGKMSLTEK